MAAIVNNSKYKRIEKRWQKALKEGKEVEVTINVEYDGANKRPKKFNIIYFIDGQKRSKTIPNGGL